MDEMRKTSIAEQLAEESARRSSSDATRVAQSTVGEDDNVLRHILPGQHLLRIPVDRVAPASEGQARQDFDEERLKALADSLRRSGVREPIIVTPHGAEPGRFQIVAGERRWRAAQLAGLLEVPCIVDPSLVERKDKLLAQAEENLHRENLNAVEEAAVLVQLMEARHIDAKEAGDLLGKGQRQVRRLLQLHAAAAPIKRAVARGQLDARAAIEMVRIHKCFLREDESPSGAQALKRIERLIERYVREQWPMRRLEKFEAQTESKDPAEGETAPDLAPTSAAPSARTSKVPDAPEARFVMARTDGRLTIDLDLIDHGQVAPEERATLIALLEELLFKVRRV
jgi:ParB family chromosome partitioning protein